ncbi:hypothetical protein Y032_0013g2121 [Ancylostoma ceylanicum]|uniref:Uncharacterized protein n=1 Tax=Ancylostoma ceylanicum TaxID=53326 RepID=A0A016VC17_9BILA|nr:hypothetical protein Y032_0013g2121 [Ancylostoma ceylanicum]
MISSKGNLCRRKYDELSNQFSVEVEELVRKYGYTMSLCDSQPRNSSIVVRTTMLDACLQERVDCCMKRLLKIAESRDPTPNDLKVSAALGPMSKEHLERFFHIFRTLTQSREFSHFHFS